MRDEDIEGRLRRYQPVGPAPELRERILVAHGRPEGLRDNGARRAHRSVWWHVAAAAILLAAAVVLHSATDRVDRRIALAIAPAREADRQRLEDLVRELGGDPSARMVAEALLVVERMREQTAASAMETPQ